MAQVIPKGNDRIPTIHFRVLPVGFRKGNQNPTLLVFVSLELNRFELIDPSEVSHVSAASINSYFLRKSQGMVIGVSLVTYPSSSIIIQIPSGEVFGTPKSLRFRRCERGFKHLFTRYLED